MSCKFILIIVFLLCTVFISAQDFKNRLISLWLIILYWIVCIISVLFLKDKTVLFSNFIGSLMYFTFFFSVIFLFYFIKYGRFVNIIDSKIGLGDILILPAIGVTMNIICLIVFFAIGFLMAALAGLIFGKKNQSIPLAGILVSWHFIFTILAGYFPDLIL